MDSSFSSVTNLLVDLWQVTLSICASVSSSPTRSSIAKDSSDTQILWLQLLRAKESWNSTCIGGFLTFIFSPHLNFYFRFLSCFSFLLAVLLLPTPLKIFKKLPFHHFKTVNMPLKHAKRLLCTYKSRLLSYK